jgi:hypothetical protein
VIYPALFGPPSFSQIPGMRHPCRVWGLGVVGNGKWERGFVGDCCGSRPAVAPTGGSSWLLWFATGGRSYGGGPHGCCGSRPAVAPTGGSRLLWERRLVANSGSNALTGSPIKSDTRTQ